jgi:gamma-D-glutamyl-L-lysine dipeptidyl-peptidase
MSSMDSRGYVIVPVTALWASPTAPRDVDAWGVAPLPDVAAWMADLDAAQARQGLNGRMLTQLECCEPVLIAGDAGRRSPGADEQRWLRILAPMQPSGLDGRGYPGWVRAEHIGDIVPDCPPTNGASDRPQAAPDARAFITAARKHLGVPYLWGGMCEAGLDCSGLVHLSLRRIGVLVPRDADDQYDACEHIPAEQARPGDLYFFARDGRRPHHVGIVTGPGRMLHAPRTGSVVVEEELTAPRKITLIGAGRLPLAACPTGSTR